MMTGKPFFSVLVAAHNAAGFIRTCLDSIRMQTFQDYELIIVCDKCEDNTAEICREYSPNVIETENGLCGLSRNVGLDCARGEYVLYADDDDWFLKDSAFQLIADALKASQPDILLFGFHWKGKGDCLQDANWRTWSVWNKCWRREFIGPVRFDDFEYGEDVAYAKKMFGSSPKLAYLNEVLYYYNFRRENSQTWKYEHGLLQYKSRSKKKPVLFVTGLGKDLNRAENMKALFDAYQGEKHFISAHDPKYGDVLGSGHFGLQVIDVFPTIRGPKTIMVWHAIQGGKYIGLDQKGTYYRKELADLMDYIVVAGRGGVEMFHQCTGVPKDRILNLGMPRTDRYFAERKEKKNPMLEQYKRVYLFVPTFRGQIDTPMPRIDFEKIDSLLADNEIFLVKPHPYGRPFDITWLKHVFQVDRMEPSVNYLYDADVVITDYSSIIFDGWLMGKPAVLFEKQAGYVRNRGMYLKYPDEYCPRFATKEEGMIILAREARHMMKTEQDCLDYVADMCDGHSCERICKLIEEVRT